MGGRAERGCRGREGGQNVSKRGSAGVGGIGVYVLADVGKLNTCFCDFKQHPTLASPVVDSYVGSKRVE